MTNQPRSKTRLPHAGSPVSSSPGIETTDLTQRPTFGKPTKITCVDYCADQVYIDEVQDFERFLLHHRPSWSTVRWINVVGLEQPHILRALAEKYQLHPLALEDLLSSDQRPKAEEYPESSDNPGRLFIIARLIDLEEDRVSSQQVSIFLGRQTLITFEEHDTNGLDPVWQRLQKKGSRLREGDASMLLHAILDSLVDRFFPVLEAISDRLEVIEDEISLTADQSLLHQIYGIKREMVLLRRTAWPMRDLIANLLREKHECLSETARTYFRDIYDHGVQIMDLIETYREISNALTETFMSILSTRLNQIMKVLTVIGTIFIPLTFLAGVYGMNMPIPENQYVASYYLFWVFCILTAGGMLWYFRKRGWI